MPTGTLRHLPFRGGAWEQDETLMLLIGIAWQTWYIFKYKPMNKMKLTIEDSDFIAWVHGDEVTNA